MLGHLVSNAALHGDTNRAPPGTRSRTTPARWRSVFLSSLHSLTKTGAPNPLQRLWALLFQRSHKIAL